VRRSNESCPHRGTVALASSRWGTALRGTPRSESTSSSLKASGAAAAPGAEIVLIVDAGPLYAAAARRDKHHEQSVRLLSRSERPLLVPALVITEVSYLLSDRIGAEAELALARSLADGELVAEPVLDSDWARIADLMEEYLDLPLGMVDASVIALAERRELEVIATFDQRHFRVVRPRHVEAFTLVP